MLLRRERQNLQLLLRRERQKNWRLSSPGKIIVCWKNMMAIFWSTIAQIMLFSIAALAREMWLKPCHFVLLNLILKYRWTMYFLLLDMLPLQLIDLFEEQGYSCPDLYVLWLVWCEIVIIWAIVSFYKGYVFVMALSKDKHFFSGFQQSHTSNCVLGQIRPRLGGLLERLHERLQVKPSQTFVL